jgi:hypothetical protein
MKSTEIAKLIQDALSDFGSIGNVDLQQAPGNERIYRCSNTGIVAIISESGPNFNPEFSGYAVVILGHEFSKSVPVNLSELMFNSLIASDVIVDAIIDRQM